MFEKLSSEYLYEGTFFRSRFGTLSITGAPWHERTTYIICYELGTRYQIINKYSGNEKQTVRSWDSWDDTYVVMVGNQER